MTLFKKLKRSTFVQELIAQTIAFYIRLVWWTSRWSYHDVQYFQKGWSQQEGPLIGLFWHGRLLMMIKNWKGPKKLHMLSSPSADGVLIGRMLQKFHYGSFYGSNSKKGAEATRRMISLLNEGDVVAITPDGPRGPRHHFRSNAISVARKTGVGLFPTTYSTTRGVFLKSWDRFLIPFPFGRGVFVYGEPIYPKDSPLSDDELRVILERRMVEITETADRLCGWTWDEKGHYTREVRR